MLNMKTRNVQFVGESSEKKVGWKNILSFIPKDVWKRKNNICKNMVWIIIFLGINVEFYLWILRKQHGFAYEKGNEQHWFAPKNGT